VVNSSVNWRLRDRLSTGPANLPTFSLGTVPLVPVMGDWDGDGDKTPGYYKGGVFTLSNNLDGSGPPVSFTFGQVNGFPVAGNWDGDLDDEVAVFRNGTWEVRKTTTPGDPSLFTPNFVFGTGVWPTTTPVAGDWDGNGTDGIGYYNGNGAGIGTWNLRPTASAGVASPSFSFEAAQPGYPVVGDWDGDKFDTVGTKTGATWSLSNTHVNAGPVSPVVDPLYVFDFTVVAANDLPLVWQYGIGP
jgi:endoglucanase